jgi:hypothetical protein
LFFISFSLSLSLLLSFVDFFAIEGTRDVSNVGCKSVDLLLASLGGLAAAVAAAYAGELLLRRRKLDQGASMGYKDVKIAPLIERKDSGRRSNLERFSHYVGKYSYILSMHLKNEHG